MAPVLSQYIVMPFFITGSTSNFVMNFFIQTASLAASDATIYSALVVESAVVDCFELFQLAAPPFKVNRYPVYDLLSSLSVRKLASQ